MAKKGIDTSRLPSLQELLATQQTSGPADAINSLMGGVTQGMDISAKLAERRMRKEQAMREAAQAEMLNKRQAEQDALAAQQRGRVDAFASSPTLDLNLGRQAFPEEVLRSELARKLQAEKEAAELKRATLKTGKEGPTLTPGEKARDIAFGKDVAQFETGGGRESADKSLNKLSESITRLDSLSKQGSGKKLAKRAISAFVPDAFEGLVLPGLTEVGQDLRSNVLGSLRATLGPQFTEKEGERIFKQTFDPTLDPKVSLKRAQDLQKELIAAKNAKEQAAAHFRQFGSLRGFKAPSIGGVAMSEQDLLGDSAGSDDLTPDEMAELQQLRQELGQ